MILHSNQHIFINGRIFTSNPEQPHAEAMITEDGVIQWIGTMANLAYDPDEAGITDLGGRRVIPGFVDAHMHPVLLANLRKQITVMPPEIHSIRELIGAIRRRREEQGADQWIEGWGYDEQGLAEKRSPNRYDLDAGCSDAPVSLLRTCAHIRCVNSKALEIAGIDRNTPDPPGGEIERDENGEPTGVLKENARNLVLPFIPVRSAEKQVENLLELGNVLTSHGITAICDMGNLEPGDNYPIYVEAARRGFRQRTGVYYMWDYFVDDPDFYIPEHQFDCTQKIFSAGLKLIGDGSVSGKTAWMNRPYPGSVDNYGISVCGDYLVETAVAYCKEKHCQLALHGMGGRAISRMIDRAVQEEAWTDKGVPYVRIEHVTDPSDDSIRKAAGHGISFVTQPIFLYAESASYVKNLGAEWTKQCYPVDRILDAGVILGFSTDAPATFWADPSDPFPGLKLAVTRISADGTDCGREHAIDMETAVRLYTAGAAQAAGFDRIGMLTPGYHGDFVVLDRDLFQIPVEEIDRVHVVETYMDGECVYDGKRGKDTF